ncbi:hypothetical protein LCGC14_2113810 [marine sediment metagenome]|uniref:Uncharacterized protein n=1 Tax=marine sediment metagenome TaxID=412755 RepID=A0A0F9ETF4_9ZZZZ
MRLGRWQLVTWPSPSDWAFWHGTYPYNLKPEYASKILFDRWVMGPLEVRRWRD